MVGGIPQRGLAPGNACSSHTVLSINATQTEPLAYGPLPSFIPSIPFLCKSCELYRHSTREPNLSASLKPPPLPTQTHPSKTLLADPQIPLLPLQSALQTAARGILSKGTSGYVPYLNKASITLRVKSNGLSVVNKAHVTGPCPVSRLIPNHPSLTHPLLPEWASCYTNSSTLLSLPEMLFPQIFAPHFFETLLKCHLISHLTPFLKQPLTCPHLPPCTLSPCPALLLHRISYSFTVVVPYLLPIHLTKMKAL